MSKSLERRIVAVEHRLSVNKDELCVICTSGGLEGGIAKRASFAGRYLEGDKDETFDDFYKRAIEAAKACAAKQIVFGGMPPNPPDWSYAHDAQDQQ